MNSHTLTLLLKIAALCHLGLIWAGASMPKAVSITTHLAKLPTFIRRLFYVYLTFIGIILISFGVLTFVFAGQMAAGDPVARGLCLVLTIFWAVRLFVATFVFDVRIYITNWFYRLGYYGLNTVFIYLLAVYSFTFWNGGRF